MSTATELVISGCKVKFPVKAYRSQVAMMSKIICSLQKSQNSLLESPTGSGKSLALLCASLAWQEAEKQKVENFNTLLEQATTNQDPVLRDRLLVMAGPGVEMQEEPVGNEGVDLDEAAIQLAKAESMGGFIPADPDDDDFVEPTPKRAKLQDENSVAYHLPVGDVDTAVPAGKKQLRMPKKQFVPKVYFGTRTHKQVSQIVRELKKTAYTGVRMTILGSREHTCIHPTISRSYNKNQDCQELIDKKKGGGCRFQYNVKSKLASHYSLRSYLGHENAWDLEDIVKVGKKVKCCPYFAVRELRNSAELIICPYNYLVDPKIRKSMDINLKNQVVVLDEAHNIEDSARDAVSGTFSLEDIGITIQECEKMVGFQVLPEVHSGLASFCSRLANWMQRSIEAKPDYSDFNSSSRVWKGTSGMSEWNEMVFAPSSYGEIKNLVEQALQEQATAKEEQEEGEQTTPVLSKKASDILDGIFMVLDYMYARDSLYRDDYRMAVVSTQTRKKGGAGGRGWMSKGDKSATLVSVVTLHFWCLNPAVCFEELKNSCRSIVLTSGTLSPIVTFASELDVKFPITLEADHVIDRRQVWVGTLSHGPTGHSLNATYRNTETYAFQDEVGKLVESVCNQVPHGVLLFLPSYKMLDNLVNRWQATGTWANIMQKKSIVGEPRHSDQLDGVMKEFYEGIVHNNGQGDCSQDGALFMAVCRGKVSEGLDFADNNARAVICVGIPFPNVKDSLVDLKRKYNDFKRSTRDPNILSGAEWYEIQAFRALNQALGRCIRHKKDWGAILMVDDRYGRNERYVNSLSKWVRKNITHYNNTRDMLHQLNNFTLEMKHMMEEEACQETVESSTTSTQADPSSSTQVNTSLVDEKENLLNLASKPNTVEEDDSSPHISAWTIKQETLAAKLAKLQNFKREASQKLDKGKDVLHSKHLDNVSHLGTNGLLSTVSHLNTTQLTGGDTPGNLSYSSTNPCLAPSNNKMYSETLPCTKLADKPPFPDVKNDLEVEKDKSIEKIETVHNDKSDKLPPTVKARELIPAEDEVVNVKEKSLLLADMEDIEEESKASDRRWVQMFKRRKERKKSSRDSKSPVKDGVGNTTVVPDTPEKCENDPMTLIDWDNDVLPPSDDENEKKPWSDRKKRFSLDNSKTTTDVSTEEELIPAADAVTNQSPVVNNKQVKSSGSRNKKKKKHSPSVPKPPVYDSDDDFV